MPTILPESPTWISPVTAPANTELADGASVASGLQALTSRSAYLNAIIGVGGTGTKRMWSLANRADLKAETTQVDGDVVQLLNGEGYYYFNAASAAAEDLPWIVAPNVGAGRWRHFLRGAKGAYLATIVAGKVVEPVPNRIVSISSYGTGLTTSAYYATSTTYADVDAAVAKLDLAVTAGDRVMLDAMCELYVEAAAGNTAYCRIAVVDGGVTYGLDEAARKVVAVSASSSVSAVTMSPVWTAITTGTLTVKLQAKSANVAYSAGVNRPISLRGMVVRP